MHQYKTMGRFAAIRTSAMQYLNAYYHISHKHQPLKTDRPLRLGSVDEPWEIAEQRYGDRMMEMDRW